MANGWDEKYRCKGSGDCALRACAKCQTLPSCECAAETKRRFPTIDALVAYWRSLPKQPTRLQRKKGTS